MCGISGLIDFRKRSNEVTLKKMTDALSHRGPDDAGYFFENNYNAQIGLGHRRLSIIDLSKNGHQPMSFQNCIIVFNGEIYNYSEIRLKLEAFGYIFESNSDTEVILKAYHKWGINAINDFNGMFAIAIYDREARQVTLIRDRAGVKPIYWYFRDGLFMFASELKSFHKNDNFQKQLDPESLSLFLELGYIPEPHSIFANTSKLQAGHILRLNLQDEKISIQRYWNIIECYGMPKHKLCEDEAISETNRLLTSACNYRMVADVPVGVFLSGGYDSSTVAAILQSSRTDKIKTFSIGFYEKEYNEAHHALKVAEYLGTDHTELYCTAEEATRIVPMLPEIWDEPFADVSAIPTLLVSQLARNRVKVSLSADGGDELFGGYNKYNQAIALNRILSFFPLRRNVGTAMSMLDPCAIPYFKEMEKFNQRYTKIAQSLKSNNIADLLRISGGVFSSFELSRLLKFKMGHPLTNFDTIREFSINSGQLDVLMGIDYMTYQVDDILTKVDRATMSVGLEGREPLLDYRLIEFVSRLDSNLKIKGGINKYLLKQVTHKYLPEKLMKRPKMGFGVPIGDWLKSELKCYLDYYLNESRLAESGIYNVNYVVRLKSMFENGLSINSSQLWNLLIFELWREKWGN